MAELDEGTYVILNVYDLTLAIDSRGALDKSGTDIWLHKRNDTDAQIWAVVKQAGNTSNSADYYQFYGSLTGKCMDIAGNVMADNTNVRQWDDNNTAAQRFQITADGKTVTYQNQNYPSYLIQASTDTNYVVTTNIGQTQVKLWHHTDDDRDRWIFVPVPTISERGAYIIVPYTDETQCMSIDAKSTASGANVILDKIEDSPHQSFLITTDTSESYNSFIMNVNSGKFVRQKDYIPEQHVEHATPDIIQSYGGEREEFLAWAITQHGSMTLDGVKVPTYIIRQVIGGSSVYTIQRSGPSANGLNLKKSGLSKDEGKLKADTFEMFAFVKTEVPVTNLETPGALTPDIFTRVGTGTVVVKDLTFQSKYTSFQARYKVRRYKNAAKTSYTDTNWMNIADDSTSRSGWGDAWTPTFEVEENGVIALPFEKSFGITTGYPFIDVIVEVRVYADSWGDSEYQAHGPVKQTVVHLNQIPTVTLSSAGFGVSPTSGEPVMALKIESSLGAFERLKARILGEDGDPITDWKSSTNSWVYFDMLQDIYRIPDNGESIRVEYNILTSQSTQINGAFEASASFRAAPPISIEYANDDSATAIGYVDISSFADLDYLRARCYIVADSVDGTRLFECEELQQTVDFKRWKLLPSLNRDCKVVVILQPDSVSNPGLVLVSTATCRVNSHLFMWNWTASDGTEPYNEYAGIFLNSDSPPKQTRTYTTDIKFQSPAGRIHPVAFSGRNIGITLGVEGIIVDPDAYYVAAGPLPSHTSIEHVKKLIPLSGKGIHPLYRSPYGDRYTVGIESVDISKTELNKSSAKVTQRAVED